MKMPKRPKQHQVEDLSLLAFKSALPREWVFREKERDYGIDGEVEVFDNNGVATGLVFLVQLKATDSKDPRAQKTVKLSNASINYFKALDLEVLVLRYAEETKELYYRWARKIDRYKSDPDAKTFSFTLGKDEKWDINTPDKLTEWLNQLNYLKNRDNILPLHVYTNFSFSNLNGITPLRLKSYLRDFLRDKSFLVKLTSDLKMSQVSVIISKNEMSVSLLDTPGCYFHSIDKIQYSNENEIISDIFTAFTLALFYFNKTQNAIQIFEGLVEAAPALKDINIAFPIIEALVKQNKSNEALKLWMAIPRDRIDYFANQKMHMLISFSFIGTEYHSSHAYKDYLLAEIKHYKKLNEKKNQGVCYYNYANFLRSCGNFREALPYYNKALKLHPHYHHEPYIFYEIAGILFDIGRHHFSAHFYKKSLDIKQDIEITARYADALMMEGNYAFAQVQFKKYFTESDDVEAEYLLKNFVIDYIIDNFHIKSQNRKYKPCMDYISKQNIDYYKLKEIELKRILDLDAISPLLWYNLGIVYHEEKNYEDAMFGFLISALHNRIDEKAWINALNCATLSNIENLIMPIMYTGYQYNGEDFMKHVYKFIEQIQQLPEGEKSAKKLEAGIESLINTIQQKRENKTPLLRVYDGQNFKPFEEIFEPKNTK